MNVVRNIIALAIILPGFLLVAAGAAMIAPEQPWIAAALVLVGLPMVMFLSSLFGGCWKCDRSLYLSPDETYVMGLLPSLLFWRRCPRCGVSAFSFSKDKP